MFEKKNKLSWCIHTDLFPFHWYDKVRQHNSAINLTINTDNIYYPTSQDGCTDWFSNTRYLFHKQDNHEKYREINGCRTYSTENAEHKKQTTLQTLRKQCVPFLSDSVNILKNTPKKIVFFSKKLCLNRINIPTVTNDILRTLYANWYKSFTSFFKGFIAQ